MGVVYEAEQLLPKRRIALKILRGGAWADDLSRRLFDREIRALAQLEHPSIARIYDAGVTPDGQAYFGMEYVDGLELEAFISTRPPIGPRTRGELRYRLELFLQICRAVAWAHQRAVIHRDLKSSNILVAAPAPGEVTPAVKVLDFGVARIAESEGSLTIESGLVLGTLTTMSPEQTRGNPATIDVRSDVYSLGVILYGLLTGARPYRTEGLDLVEAIRVIREAPVRRPAQLQPMVAGDIEVIILACLEKDPERRYTGVNGLIGDIERFLDRRPILARRATLAYQVRMLANRYRVAASISGGLLLLLVGFAVVMSFMFDRERRLRERVESESRKSRRTTEFVQGMLSSVNPSVSGVDVRVRDVLDQSSGDIESTLGDQPEVRAAVQETIGEAYLALGLYAPAESNLRRSLATRLAILPPDDPAIATVQQDLGRLLLESGGDLTEAEALIRQAVASRRARSGTDDLATAAALNDMARVLEASGRPTEALAVCREAIEIRGRLSGADSPESAESLNNLASILQSLGRPAEAEPLLREACRIWTLVLGPDHPAISTYQLNLARNLQDQFRFAESESLAQAALTLSRRHLGEVDHPVTAAAENALALTLLYQGRYAAAGPVARDALAMWRRLTPTGAHPGTAAALSNLGFLHQATGKPAQAETCYREALSMAEVLSGPAGLAVADAEFNMARIAQVQERHAEACDRLAKLIHIRRQQQGDAGRSIAEAQVARGLSQLELGQIDSAEASLKSAVSALGDPNATWSAALAGYSLGIVLGRRGECDEARALMTPAERWLFGPAGVPAWKTEALIRGGRHFALCGDHVMAERCRHEVMRLGSQGFQ